MPTVDLVADLGEGFGAYSIGDDKALLDIVSSANIACGFHAGDPDIMDATVAECVRTGVGIGAHPSFPDLRGFGRRAMDLTADEVRNDVIYQLGALSAFAAYHGGSVSHLAPHGRLGNLVATRADYAGAVADAAARVDPKLAWQVFAYAFTPSAELQSQLRSILPRLDDASFAQRERASAELAKLGQPAALALMRQNRRGLSNEQQARIDAFIASYKIVTDAEAGRLRGNSDFLLDCLYSDDATIRREALARLRTITGKPILFDEQATPQKRLEAIARLRQSIGTPPATQEKK